MMEDPDEDYEFGPSTPDTTPGARKHNKPGRVSLEEALERNDQLEKENRLLRRRLRQAEKELTDIKVAPNAAVHAKHTAEARDRAARVDATSDDVIRAIHQRDTSLVELRRKLIVVSRRFGKLGKEDEVEANEKNVVEAPVVVAAVSTPVAAVHEEEEEEEWDRDTVDTSYDTAEDEDVESEDSAQA